MGPRSRSATGELCKAYGAPALLRIPGRLKISWPDGGDTLRIDTDAGEQTRLLHVRAAHRRGEILLNVVRDLDLATEKAASLLLNTYRMCRRSQPASAARHRARNVDWLNVISDFEDAEIKSEKTNSQLFARYRRIIDGVRFVEV